MSRRTLSRRLALFALPLLTTTALLAGGCVKPDPVAQKEIQARYDQQSVSYANKDVDGVLAVCSPDYEDVNDGKSDNLETYRKTLQMFLGLSQSATVRSTVREALVKDGGKTAIVTVDRHFEVTLHNPENHQSQSLVIDETLRDTWLKDPAKGWLKRRSTVSMSTTKKDRTALGGEEE